MFLDSGSSNGLAYDSLVMCARGVPSCVVIWFDEHLNVIIWGILSLVTNYDWWIKILILLNTSPNAAVCRKVPYFHDIKIWTGSG